MVKPYSITDEQMMRLYAMDLETDLLIHGELDEHDWGKQGEHDGRRRCGRCAFIPWYVLRMRAQIEPDLPLDHRLHQ
jgi:hypothetical protein